MKRVLLAFFIWVSLLCGVFSESNLPVLSSDCALAISPSFQAPARRSLLTDAHNAQKVETVLMAGLDGRVYLLDDQTFEPIWSFSSGGDIYSSYQAPHLYDKEHLSSIEGHYYIDIGDEFNLYAHHSLGPPQKLMETVEDYVSSTPHILEDGRIVIGSKTSSVFLIDGITGRIIKKCEFSNHQHKANTFPLEATVTQQHQSETEPTLPIIHFTRTDYRLESFMPLSSDKILWNVSVAQIKASFLCQGTEESFEVTHQNTKYVESGLTYNMPLACQSQASIYHLRKHKVLEFLRAPYALPKANQQDSMLPSSNSEAPPPQPNVKKLIERIGQSLIFDFQDAQNSSDQGAFIPEYKHSRKSGVHLSILVAIVLSAATFLLQLKFPTRSPETNAIALHPKKKRPRKPGKGGNKTGKQDKDENEINHTYKDSENNFWANLDQPICYGSAGQRIGKLFVSSEVIGKGSNGTIVLEGIYQGRPVAVKRLVRAHNEIALKEIQNLIASDHHPNIINWYGVEEDKDFVYLALERCTCSLNDLIIMCMKASGISTLSEAAVASECVLGSCRNGFKQTDLWKYDGYPSPSLLKLMRDIIAGIAHLHEIGIVHRDLKPQNVLITNERTLSAKVSDMGISKRLIGDVSSFGSHATGSGSSGWQAPEQLLQERQTRAVDMFSLGCVLFFCITGGKHPFGGHLERDSNIVKNKIDLFLIEYIPEAVDLFLRLLHPDAEMRPKAVEVLCHPLFWNAEMRLSFLRDTSDRVELEDREASSELLQELEYIAPLALGSKWDEKMDPSFLNNIGRYRRYKYDSVRDLLRVMRNKLSHYRELPTEIQEVIGPVPEGFDRYFTSRFPKLLIEVYKVMLTYCRTEELFAKYFECIKE